MSYLGEMKPGAFKAARQALGLTQAELAAKLGLSDGRTVRRYEAGETPVPLPTATLLTIWAITAPRARKKKAKK